MAQVITKRFGIRQFKVKSVRIDTEAVTEEDGSARNVSVIEIVVSRTPSTSNDRTSP